MKTPGLLDSSKQSKPKKVSPGSRVRPRIQEIASEAGVALGTVSAVLNGKGRMSEATRSRVEDTIARLGYRPNLYASNLARRQTNLFGVIVSNLQNPFFAETAQAVEEEAARHGYQISLMATNFVLEQHRSSVKQLLGAKIAGIAVLTSEDDAVSRAIILASGVPAVFLDAGKPEGNCSILRVDSRGGMRAAVEHLIELGHRDFLYVRNSQRTQGPVLHSHRLRHLGFAAAVRSVGPRGVRTHTVDIPGPGADAGEAAIQTTWGSFKYTAVVANTDLVAMGIFRGLQARGLRIPEDVSVVGFDNTYFSRFMNPPLSTVDVPRPQLSRFVVEALAGKLTGQLLHLPTQLVLRNSTAPPAQFL
jgi:DNA-binding LacI/PurR family transcriptional regulator